jgi:hypothetical protein
MNNLDIVNLIENNPLTRLNRDYQSKFVRKVQQHFTDYEQQLFVSSFYCYLNYDPITDYIINLDEIWKWLGFSRKDFCKKLLTKHFKANVDYIILKAASADEGAGKPKNNIKRNLGGAGKNKETIMLNINTFKKMCLKVSTQKADTIHDYFLKLEQVFQEIVKEESDELRLQLDFKDQQIYKIQTDSSKQKHNLLLQEFNYDCNIVYIIKVKSLGNKYVIKIGESRRGITGRYNEHKSSYPECLLLDCFSIKRLKDFENFLHSCLSAYRYKQLVGHENETELFLVGEELSYSYILDLVKENIVKYNDDQMEVNKYLLEIEKLKIENENLRLSLNQNPEHISISNLKTELLSCIREEFRQLRVNVTNTTTRFGEPLPTLGPYVQQLNADNLTLVRVFENISEVCKVFSVPRSSITKAVKENTIYLNSRWNFVERHLDASCVTNVNPTRQLQKQQNLGYIAKLNQDKSKIIKVYLDRKTASIENGYQSVAYLDYFVKQRKLVDSYYYLLYHSVEEPLRKAFLQEHKLDEIVLYKKYGVGQFDANNGLVKEYKSKQDCQEYLKIGNKTLCKALATGKPVMLSCGNRFVFRYLSDKLST